MSQSRPLPSQALQEAQRLHQRGDLHGAERAYKQAIAEDGSNAKAWQMLGVLHYQRKAVPKAFECFEKALTLDPANIEARINFGVMLQFEGRLEESVQTFDEALRHDPLHAEALHMKGFVLIQLKRHALAANTLRLATQANPRHAGAWFQLGNALFEQGLIRDAQAAFSKATELNLTHYEAWNNLGSSLVHLGQWEEAEGALRRASQLQPNNPEVALNLGTTLFMRGNTAEAGPLLEQIVKRSSKNPRAWFFHGQAHMRMKRLEEAAECFGKSIALEPVNDVAIRLRHIAHSELGLVDDAKKDLDEIERIRGGLTPAQQIMRGFILPTIPRDRDEIRESRARVMETAKQMAASGLSVTDPLFEIGGTCFFLGYDRESEAEHQKAIAQMYLAVCPELEWTAPHCTQPSPPRDRVRLGVCSAFLRNHSVGKVLGPLIQRLDREKFEVIILHTDHKSDDITKAIESRADKVVCLALDLFESRRQIAEEELDALFYPDIGMDPHTYFLAFSRLAPVQFTAWGHPSTTGIPNMDFFISTEAMETSESAAEYSEKLVLLPDVVTYFERPAKPEQPKSRAELGLPEDKTLYGCPQMLFKLHPDFDDAAADLLRKDPDGVLVLTQGRYAPHRRLLEERWRKLHPDVADRLLFLPYLSFEDYLSLILAFDAILDPFYFGGGTTSLEIFAMGRPVVTMPTQLMRGRITCAEYMQMGFTDLLADSPEAFVDMAYRLAHDKDWQKRCREQIEQKSGALFENERIVRQFEDWVLSATPRTSVR